MHQNSERLYHARAKYIPDGNGGLRLAMVQGFDHPVFNPSTLSQSKKHGGFGAGEEDPGEEDPAERELGGLHENIERATRRAKISAFDKILCNPDLDVFATFTYAPESVEDKASYEDCYNVLRPWLSNRVQRRDLKYVIVPELHKSGFIHFHGIMNSSALNLERAYSAKNGRALSHAGNPLFNVSDWRAGFTSAEIIQGGELDREKVAKYIFKYMGKQVGTKIGGRYLLTGGNLAEPTYIYGDSVEQLLDGSAVKYDREVEIPGGGKYFEFSTL